MFTVPVYVASYNTNCTELLVIYGDNTSKETHAVPFLLKNTVQDYNEKHKRRPEFKVNISTAENLNSFKANLEIYPIFAQDGIYDKYLYSIKSRRASSFRFSIPIRKSQPVGRLR